MNPPSTSIFTGAPEPHVSEDSLTGSDDVSPSPASPEPEALRFARKPYTPPRFELLED